MWKCNWKVPQQLRGFSGSLVVDASASPPEKLRSFRTSQARPVIVVSSMRMATTITEFNGISIMRV
ncbi:Hypothetical predicted protein, partial [Olea europaea subsp. europaea]